MKRLGNLFERLCDFRTLEAAFARVRKGKARRSDVAAFARGMPESLNAVADELRAGTFRFGNYHFFKVYDPKERLIAAAPVRERIVHHAVIALIGARLNARSRRRFLRKLALYDGLAAERGERWLQNRLTALFAFARQVHSYGFRRKAVGENGQGNGECSSRRWLWQQQRLCPALSLGVSVQQQSLQPQQQQRLLRPPVAGSSRSSVQEAHQNRLFFPLRATVWTNRTQPRPGVGRQIADGDGRGGFDTKRIGKPGMGSLRGKMISKRGERI